MFFFKYISTTKDKVKNYCLEYLINFGYSQEVTKISNIIFLKENLNIRNS